MKKITFTLLAVIATISSALAQNADSLQRRDDSVQHICAQADLYINTADSLIQYGQTKTRMVSIADAAKASEYVLKAIQINKKFDDTLAIRNNFNRLADAYVMQNKFTEAKWYILQANTLSRKLHDTPYTINGLVKLAGVKMSIKDYELAQKDLQDAIALSQNTHNIPAQIEAEKKLAVLDDKMGKLKDAKSTIAHYTLLTTNLKKARAQQALAMQRVAKVKKPVVSEAKQAEILSEELNANAVTFNASVNRFRENK